MSWKARRFLTKHHNVAQAKKGDGHGKKGADDFICMLTPEHHQLFHKLFGLCTFREAADVLLRLDRLCKRQP
jgi:hypothetical protein